jgi:hypothetical protein
MAKTRRTTFDKLQRERARQVKQAEKRERRQARRATDEMAAGPVSTHLDPADSQPAQDGMGEANGSE